MGSQRIASSLINRPYHPPGWGEPAPGEEPGEGEDGYTNPPLEDGYSELSDGVIVDMQATLRELFDNPDLEMNPESFHLQSLGEPIEFNCSPGSGAEYEGGEGGEGGPGESEYIDPLCACEQSLYWANEAGYDCQTLNVIYFYHPDYLGSVEYITDMRGEPYQFFLNTPWGDRPFRNKPVACFREGAGLPRGRENQFAKNYTSFSSRFRFNGKEWEGRTFKNRPVAYFSEGARLPRGRGNFYYGARYYDPKISVWLSVNPLAHEYQSLSSYTFTGNNPIMLVDPDGKRIKPLNGGAFKALVGVLSGFTENYRSLYGIHVHRDGKKQVGAITATSVYKDFKAFKKAAKKAGVDKEDMEAAYGVYQKLAEKKTTELMMIRSSEATTIGVGDGEASTVADNYDYQDMKTDNPNYSGIVKDVKENGALTEGMRQDIFENDKYNSDQRRDGWVYFRDYDTYGQNLGMINGVLIFDGTSNDQSVMQQALIDALANLNW